MAMSFNATLSALHTGLGHHLDSQNYYIYLGYLSGVNEFTKGGRLIREHIIKEHDWLCGITAFGGTGESPRPVELRFDGAGNQNFKITVNSGSYKDRILAQNNDGYVGAYGDPSFEHYNFRIRKDGVFIKEITERLKDFEIITMKGYPLQIYGGGGKNNDVWRYIVGAGGENVEFSMASFTPL